MSTGLLICSLLSPAIILTFSPSGSIFDLSASAITRRGRGELVWELDALRREGLISTEEDVCWERVRTYYDRTGREGGGRRIRVEQVLVPVVGAGRGRDGSPRDRHQGRLAPHDARAEGARAETAQGGRAGQHVPACGRRRGSRREVRRAEPGRVVAGRAGLAARRRCPSYAQWGRARWAGVGPRGRAVDALRDVCRGRTGPPGASCLSLLGP